MPRLIYVLLSLGLFVTGIAPKTIAEEKQPKNLPGKEITAYSEQKPSADPNAPAPLVLGKYVAARLGNSNASGKYHYWSVTLPAGEYRVILDTHSSDGKERHVGMTAQSYNPTADKVEGEYLASTNSPFGRDRDVRNLKITVAGPQVIRLENGSSMAEYQFAIVPKGEAYSTPWLLKTPKMTPIKLGDVVTTPLLNGNDLFARDVYYLIELPEGDFRFTVDFMAANQKVPNAGVKVDLLSEDGKLLKSLISATGSKPNGSGSAMLLTDDRTKLLVRVRGWEASVTASLRVDPVK